jgi:cytochrome c1
MKWIVALLASIVLLGAAALWFNLRQAHDQIQTRAAWLTGGEPPRGKELIAGYGCGGCHTVPGVRGATGLSGPSLLRFGQRTYIAGQRRNTPQNLVPWLRHPQHIERGTAMPEMSVSEQDARDMAAFLYTLN